MYQGVVVINWRYDQGLASVPEYVAGQNTLPDRVRSRLGYVAG